jgi:predicted DNA-binding transcriptional regulator AlpA
MAAHYPWPRMMRRTTAAAYLDLSVAAFEREMSRGRLPFPVMMDGQERWSQTLIDEAVERLTGERVPDIAMQSNFFLRNPHLITERNVPDKGTASGRKR